MAWKLRKTIISCKRFVSVFVVVKRCFQVVSLAGKGFSVADSCRSCNKVKQMSKKKLKRSGKEFCESFFFSLDLKTDSLLLFACTLSIK